MAPGRTPSWNVIASVEPTSWLEAIAPSSDQRLPLPGELRKRVSWASPKQSLSLLAITQTDGAVTLAPLAESRKEIDAVRAALDAAPIASRASLTFAAMAIYSRIALQPDGRLRLSPGLVRHLIGGREDTVWVGSHDDRVWLWPDAAWGMSHSSAAEALRQALNDRRSRSTS